MRFEGLLHGIFRFSNQQGNPIHILESVAPTYNENSFHTRVYSNMGGNDASTISHRPDSNLISPLTSWYK